MKTWLHAKYAIVGDGKTVLSPAWVAFEGKYITDVTDSMPENLLKMLEPIDDIEHFEGMYCAFDHSRCIHEDRGCICEKCEVHKKYNLKKEDYCLKDGGM